MTQDNKLADAASARLDQLADEIQRYNARLADAGFGLELAGPLTDALAAHYEMIKALNHLPSEEVIAYEMPEADALLIARVLRLCADVPLAKLEAARINAELHTAGNASQANSAYRNARHGSTEKRKALAQGQLDELSTTAFKKSRAWIKSSVDRFAPKPARKF